MAGDEGFDVPYQLTTAFKLLLPHDLDDNPLSALAVKFGIVELLPGIQLELCFRNQDNELVADQEILERGDVDELAMPLGVKPEIFGVGFH